MPTTTSAEAYEGLYWASELKKMAPDVEVVLFTAYADIALAVEGMKRGAFDFIVKPWTDLYSFMSATGEKGCVSLWKRGQSKWTSTKGRKAALP